MFVGMCSCEPVAQLAPVILVFSKLNVDTCPDCRFLPNQFFLINLFFPRLEQIKNFYVTIEILITMMT
mgnify:CR=1 FL=1